MSGLQRSRPRSLAASWLPLGLAWLAFALRVAGLNTQSLWRDEVDTLMFATRPLAEALEMFRQPGQNGPLFFLILRPWLTWAGHSEFALRFPSALAGALTVPVGYRLILRLAGRTPALLTALLLAVAPYLVWYGQEAKMYALVTLLAVSSLWLTVAAIQHGRWWRWTLLYVVTTGAIYIHLLAALIVPVQVLWLLIAPGPGRRWQAVAVYLAALLLPYLPLAIWQSAMWRAMLQTGHHFAPLGDILLVLAAVFSLGVLPGQMFLKLLPFMLALTAGVFLWVYQARSAAPHRLSALLLTWLVLPPLMIYVISLRAPIFTERYLIWTMPAFLALIALGIVALAWTWRPLALLTLAAILALNIGGIVSQARRPIKSDFRSAAQYVAQHMRPGELLIYQIPYIRYTFTYYSSGRNDPDDTSYPWLAGPYTNHGMSSAEVDAWMSAGLVDAAAAWLIASEVAMWDARGLTEQWLAQRGTVQARAEFTRVTVTRYEFPRP